MQKHVKRIVDHLWGPTGSVILHIIVLIVLYKFVVFVQEGRQPDVEVVIMDPDAVDLDEILEPEELEDLPEIVDTVTPPEVDLSVDQPPEVDDFQEETEPMDLDVISDVQSPLTMTGLFGNRSDSGRAAALRDYNQFAKITEASVIRALDWLKKNQNPDGSWNKNLKTGLTGLGLLTFLAHGETPGSEDYGLTIEKAMKFLISRCKEDGHFVHDGGIHGVYEHAIGAYAVSEAYGITRHPSLKDVMDRSIGVIVKGQQKNGSWDYHYGKGDRSDLSVAGWQIQAMKAAKAAGADTPGLKEAMKKAVPGVKLFLKEDGNYGYSNKNRRTNQGLTGVAVLCMQLMGYATDAATRDGLRALDDAICEWGVGTSHDDYQGWPFYSWYYVSQAKFHHGKNWNAWNAEMVKTIVGHQEDDGHWLSWMEQEKKNGGAVYATTLAALTLQVYYRFLPTYKAEAVEIEEETEGDEEYGDIEIEIL